MALVQQDDPWVDPRVMPSVPVVCLLVLSLLYYSLFVNLDRATALMDSRFTEALATGANIWHYVRELTLLALVALLLGGVTRAKLSAQRLTLSPYVVIFVLFVSLLGVRTVAAGYAPEYLAYGIRPLLFVIIIAALRWYSDADRSRLLRLTAYGSVPFLLIEAAVAAYQVLASPPFFGQTIFGARPWGTFASPNNFAVAVVGILLVLVLARPALWWVWSSLVAVMVMVSGTRTALMAVVVLAGMLIVRRLRGFLLLLPLGALVGVGLLLAASSESFSGRDIEGEARLGNWSVIISDLSSTELLIGRGVGVGTNAAYLVDRARYDVPVADSQLIAQAISFGLIGVIVMLLAAVHLWRVSGPDGRALVLPVLVLMAAVFNVAEYYPVNLFLAVGAGASALGVQEPPGPGEVGDEHSSDLKR